MLLNKVCQGFVQLPGRDGKGQGTAVRGGDPYLARELIQRDICFSSLYVRMMAAMELFIIASLYLIYTFVIERLIAEYL